MRNPEASSGEKLVIVAYQNQNSFIIAAQAQTRQWLRLLSRHDMVDPESTAAIHISW